MSFKVVLLKPNIAIRKGFNLQNRIYPPLGLAYLAGSLVQAGHDAVIIDMVGAAPDNVWPYRGTHDCYGLTDNDLLERIDAIMPDLIGISGFTVQHARIIEMVHAIKERFPGIPVVLGGIHATSLPEVLMQSCPADFLIQGEGEQSLVALVDALDKKRLSAIPEIDGITYRDGDTVVVKPKLTVIDDISAIPLPAWELLPNDVYLDNNVAMPVITSRGCPYRCVFCCVSLTQGHTWRYRTAENVADEIEQIVATYHYRTITVFDDAFNIVPERVVDICKEIVRRKLAINLLVPSSLMIKHITRETLYWLKKAGCIAVSLPFEHADESIRNNIINKGLTLEKFDEVLLWCREVGLLALVNFVIGLPGETEKTLCALKEYVQRNYFKMDALAVYIGTPFPGTEFYRDCMRSHYLVDPGKNDFMDFDLYECLVNTPELKAETVNEYKRIIDKTFLELRGEAYNNEYIRRAIRKPDAEAIAYVNNVYLKEKESAWARALHHGDIQ